MRVSKGDLLLDAVAQRIEGLAQAAILDKRRMPKSISTPASAHPRRSPATTDDLNE
jgi:hypothetical protein